MKRAWVLVSALLACLLAPAALRADHAPVGASLTSTSLTYTVTPVVQGRTLRLHVELACMGDESGTFRLHLPNQFAGQGQLYRCVQNLRALSSGAVLADTSEPQVKTVTCTPNQAVQIAYDVVQDWARPLDGQDAYFRPILQPDYFHLIGSDFWVYPSLYTPNVAVTLHWQLPPGWTLADSFGVGRPDQQFDATLDEFREGVFVGGDFRLLNATIRDKPVTLAVRGKWKFSDAECARTVTRILQTEREFWRDDDFPHFLVTLIPTDGQTQGATDEAGVEMTAAVALFQPKSATLDPKFQYLVAHELFHTWNADRIPTSPDLLWFSEGFTDFYARLLLLRAGMTSLGQCVGDENARLREYYQSPVRNRPAKEASARFFTDPQLERLPYLQGAFLACRWNAAIRQATGDKSSLDDAMRDILAACRQRQTPLSLPLLADAVRRYAPALDVTGDVGKYITDGATIPPDPGGLGPGFTLAVKPIPTYELGFDWSGVTQERIIRDVRPGSSAYDAGLRDGQTVLACAPFMPGDPSQRLSLTVKDRTGTTAIEFSPAGPPVMVPQYVKAKTGRGDEASLAWFGVGKREGAKG